MRSWSGIGGRETGEGRSAGEERRAELGRYGGEAATPVDLRSSGGQEMERFRRRGWSWRSGAEAGRNGLTGWCSLGGGIASPAEADLLRFAGSPSRSKALLGALRGLLGGWSVTAARNPPAARSRFAAGLDALHPRRLVTDLASRPRSYLPIASAGGPSTRGRRSFDFLVLCTARYATAADGLS